MIRRGWGLALVALAIIVTGFTSSDRGRSATDALEECEDYAATLRRCFGERAAVPPPRAPTTKIERAAAAKRCSADRARIERACR